MALYLPGWANLVAIVTTWGIGAGLLLFGSLVCGRGAAAEFRIGAGWGAVCLVLTAWGVLIPASLRIPAVAVIIAALAVLLVPGRRPRRGDWVALCRLLLVTLPLWAVIAPVRPSQVDTFLNLLPNADYLVDYARLPIAASPPSYSEFPAAPYDTQFLAFLGSFVDRVYPASGMSLVNVMLRLVAGLAIARCLARGAPHSAPPWSLVALGMLLVTLLDPGFVPRFHFSSYGETSLAVTALLAGLLFIETPQTRRLELGLILAAMINAKQSGIGLVLALAGAAVIVGALEDPAPLRRIVVETAMVLFPAALIYGIWRYYVAYAGVDELVPLPFSQWNWAVLPAMFRGIVGSVAEKPVFFVGVVLAIASFPFLLRRRGWSQTTKMAGFFTATFFLYNGFLVVTYIAHFSALMSAEAHSYFRYNTHLSLLLVLSLALTVCEFCPRVRSGLGARRAAVIVVMAVALLSPVAFAGRLRFDIAMPQPVVWDLAAELKPYLQNRDRLALLLPGDDGEIGQMLSDYLASAPPRRLGLEITQQRTADGAALDAAAGAGYELAAISCTPAGFLGLPGRTAALVRHEVGGWHVVASWPLATGTALSRWQRARHWPALCR
jgi:hypothetical protein